MGWLVAVHAGAGRYSTRDDAALLALMQRALQSGSDLVAQLEHASTSSSDADSDASAAALVASRMLCVFERDERTNAGLGANLTELGHVECEASVACGKTRRASACANVRGVAEPSSLAHALMDQAARVAARDGARDASTRAFAFNREPPLVVVGEHARTLAKQFGIETASSESDLASYQVTPRTSASWRKWRARFRAAAEPDDAPSADSATLLASESTDTGDCADETEQLLDTVGAICIDHRGNVAAALSSGGVAYKVPGRVGLAGCPRMGCDAANAQPLRHGATRKRKRDSHATPGARSGYAVACTGRGEHFVRSGFVAHLTRALRKVRPVSLERAFRKAFDAGRDENGDEPIEGGVLALSLAPLADGDKALGRLSVQLGAAFSTPCMGVGYLHSSTGATKDARARVEILRRPLDKRSHSTRSTELCTHVSVLQL